eukprot:GILK01004332.1.p1 GENE.GILK01004332.1~~GILK01004332.1.p1  ORF type:complete len:349 (-),score=62.89 GILK01004332.1:94-1092(-)
MSEPDLVDCLVFLNACKFLGKEDKDFLKEKAFDGDLSVLELHKTKDLHEAAKVISALLQQRRRVTVPKVVPDVKTERASVLAAGAEDVITFQRSGGVASAISDLRVSVGLCSSHIKLVFEALLPEGQGDGVTEKQFLDVIISLTPAMDLTTARLELLSRVFESLDWRSEGRLSARQIAGGVSVLCGGSTQHRIAIAFSLYDDDQDGCLTFTQLTEYLSSLFAVVFLAHPESQNKAHATPLQVAVATASQYFDDREAKRNQSDGDSSVDSSADLSSESDSEEEEKISFDEFRVWCMSLGTYLSSPDAASRTSATEALGLDQSLPPRSSNPFAL